MFGTKRVFIVLILLIFFAAYWHNSDKKEPTDNQYVTRAIELGNITQTISANGTLTPVVLVNVGTQVSGTVSKLHVDYNDHVVIGQVLAELDPALLQAQLQQSEASYLSAQVIYRIAASKLKRHQMLEEQGFISHEGLDIVEQEIDAARAQLAVSKAQVDRDHANLNYSIIKSPISGVVIDRDIDIGQTVAANFQTPVLFQIAKDLRQMQINISVSEADIGQLHINQLINFTVDAFQQRTFSGTVKQVRLNPTIEENVVTYNVIAMVDNDDGFLLPGMTANIHFIVDQRENVLRVPNAALRYQPKDAESLSNQPLIYQLKQGKPTPIDVTIGITDGNFTQIISEEVQAGDPIIVREKSGEKDSESKFRIRMF